MSFNTVTQQSVQLGINTFRELMVSDIPVPINLAIGLAALTDFLAAVDAGEIVLAPAVHDEPPSAEE